MQAQKIDNRVVGANRKTVMPLDQGLYMSAKKLQLARRYLSHILRPGELHICMAMQKTIGPYIEDSGIDMSWYNLNYMVLQQQSKYLIANMLAEAKDHTLQHYNHYFFTTAHLPRNIQCYPKICRS